MKSLFFRSKNIAALLFALPLLLSACDTSEVPTKSLPVDMSSAGLAILSSDYTSGSLSLYDPAKATLLHDDCIHSGQSSLTQKLSGDLTLPTQADPLGHEIVVIDREFSTLNFVNPATCGVRSQVSVSTGFKANPHDVIRIRANKAYVTRYETNFAATAVAEDLDDGNDVLVIDPSTGQRLARIDLTGEATGEEGVLARPDRGILVNDRVYLTLGNLSAHFSKAGPGRVLVIDSVTDSVVERIDLPQQKGCSGIEYVAAAKKLYVVCGGSWADGPTQVDESALVEIDLAGASPVLGRVYSSHDLGIGVLNFSYVAVSGGTAFVSQLGNFPDAASNTPGTSDVLYAVNLASGAAQPVFNGGASNLGRAAVSVDAKRLFLPDGDFTAPKVRVFDVSTETPVAGVDFNANPNGGLPPREVAIY